MTIITNSRRTAEKWEAARNNLGLKRQFKTKEKALSRFQRSEKQSSPRKEKQSKRFESPDRKKFKQDKRPRRDNSQTEGIESAELQWRRSAGECLRCAWPSDKKGSHRVADCKRQIKLDKGTAAFPKSKDYQKMKVAGTKLQSGTENDLCDESEDEESEGESSEEESEGESSEEEFEESEGEYLDNNEEEEEQQDDEEDGNWWDTPSEYE